MNECSGRGDTASQDAQCYPISVFPKFESWNFGGRAPAVKKIGRREGGGCTSWCLFQECDCWLHTPASERETSDNSGPSVLPSPPYLLGFVHYFPLVLWFFIPRAAFGITTNQLLPVHKGWWEWGGVEAAFIRTFLGAAPLLQGLDPGMLKDRLRSLRPPTRSFIFCLGTGLIWIHVRMQEVWGSRGW